MLSIFVHDAIVPNPLTCALSFLLNIRSELALSLRLLCMLFSLTKCFAGFVAGAAG